jgi:diacylglycerol kinase
MRTKLIKWLNGFRYAHEGLIYTISTQPNMKVHVFATLTILGLALFLQSSDLQYMLLLMTVTLVMAAECMNTAIEKTVDLAMPDIHPLAKIAKDTAAGSVLLTAVFAVVSGVYIFGERIINLAMHARWPEHTPFTAVSAAVMLYFVFILVLVMQALTQASETQNPLPSLGLGLLSCLIVISVYIIMEWEYFFAIIVLYLGFLGIRIKQRHSFLAMLHGSAIGIGATVLLIWVYTLGKF